MPPAQRRRIIPDERRSAEAVGSCEQSEGYGSLRRRQDKLGSTNIGVPSEAVNLDHGIFARWLRSRFQRESRTWLRQDFVSDRHASPP